MRLKVAQGRGYETSDSRFLKVKHVLLVVCN